MFRITRDKIDSGFFDGRTSHDFDQAKWDAAKQSGKVTKFRLLDDDREIYFYGEYDGVNESESKAFAPLDQFGAAYGCTELQYKQDGKWETL